MQVPTQKSYVVFLLTLKFYSAKAYMYVRKTFHLGLLDPSGISKYSGTH